MKYVSLRACHVRVSGLALIGATLYGATLIEAFKLRQVCTLFCESAVYCLFCHVVTASNIQISRPLMEEITQFVGSS